VYKVSKIFEEVIFIHAFLNLLLSVLAIATATFLRVAEDTILEAFAILLLTVWFFASAPADVLSSYVFFVCTFDSSRGTWIIFRNCRTLVTLNLLIKHRKCVLILRLYLGQKREWITSLNILSLLHNFSLVIFIVVTVCTTTLIIAKTTLRKAFTIHFKTFRLWAFTGQMFNCLRLLFQQAQRWIWINSALFY
jgi:hypothetical protein